MICTPVRLSVKLAIASSLFVLSCGSAFCAPKDVLSAANDPLLRQAMFQQPNRLLTGAIAGSGAEGANAKWEQSGQGYANPEYQRYGADLVAAGLSTHNNSLVQNGLKVIRWGFAQQLPDGSFNSKVGFHSTSFFVEASARTLLLLEESNSPAYQSFIDQYSPKLKAAAKWLTKSDVAAKGQLRNFQYTHRRYLLAAALLESGAATQDDQLSSAAIPYLLDGLSLQTPEGINPEKGGFDVTYQMTGILFAERCYWLVNNGGLKSRLAQMITKGLNYESSKVDYTGQVSIAGSTRTGVDPEHYSNKTKGIDYRTLVQAYVYGTDITGNAQYRQIAQQIAGHHGWLS